MRTPRTNTKKAASSKAKPKKRRGAPRNNEFWKLRAKHGRQKIFSTPPDLEAAAIEYFEAITTENNALLQHDYVGGFAKEVRIKKHRPMTIAGLCIFLGVNTAYLREFEEGLKNDEGEYKDQQAKDFSAVICWIRDVIWANKFEGAAAGLFNANIISREIGLADKVESNNKTELLPPGKLNVVVESTGVPFAFSEKDVDATRPTV